MRVARNSGIYFSKFDNQRVYFTIDTARYERNHRSYVLE